jgi:hypothetical protein
MHGILEQMILHVLDMKKLDVFWANGNQMPKNKVGIRIFIK